MRRLTSVALAGLIFVTALAFWQWRIVAPVRLPQEIGLWNSDLYTIYYPVFSYLYRSAELLPSWNPYQLAGMPALASWNGGPLYPPNLLAAVLPVNDALGWLCAFHLGLAGCFTFACARALALSRAAAVLAGVLFMLNGSFLFSRIHPSYLAGHAWIPAVLLWAARVLHRPTVAGALALGVVMALQLLTGHPQILCYTAYAALAGGLVYVAMRRPVDPRHLAAVGGCLALAGLTALLVAAAQLMPSLELMEHAARGPLTLAETLPGAPTLANAILVAVSSGPAVILLFAALGDSRCRPIVIPGLVVLVLCLLVGFGTPLYTRGFFHLPGVARFRVISRTILVAAAVAAVLAAIGLDVLRATALGAVRRRLLVAACMLAAALAWAHIGNPDRTGRLLLAVIVALPLLPGRSATLAAVALVVLAAAERFAQPGSQLMIPQNNPQSFFAPPPFVSLIREQGGEERTFIVKDMAERFLTMEKSGSLYRYPVVQDQDSLLPREYERFLATMNLTQIDPTMFGGRFLPPITEAGWRSLDMLATRWIVADARWRWPNRAAQRLRLVADAGAMRVWENLRSLPRAYLVPGYEVVPDPETALARVQRLDFDPRALVLVDREIAWRPGGTAPPLEAVSFEELSPERARLRVLAPRPAVLVLADLHWPGWRVAVDGEERPLLRANYLFRAVAVEPGEHAVEFRYAPASIRVGAALSLVTLTVLAGFFVRRRRGGSGGT
jgi:hypothetical protein